MRTAGTAGDVSFSPIQIADPRCAPRVRRRVAGESSPAVLAMMISKTSLHDVCTGAIRSATLLKRFRDVYLVLLQRH